MIISVLYLHLEVSFNISLGQKLIAPSSENIGAMRILTFSSKLAHNEFVVYPLRMMTFAYCILQKWNCFRWLILPWVELVQQYCFQWLILPWVKPVQHYCSPMGLYSKTNPCIFLFMKTFILWCQLSLHNIAVSYKLLFYLAVLC